VRCTGESAFLQQRLSGVLLLSTAALRQKIVSGEGQYNTL